LVSGWEETDVARIAMRRIDAHGKESGGTVLAERSRCRGLGRIAALALATLTIITTGASSQTSDNVILRSNVDFDAQWTSDIWGYSGGGREVAIIGGFDGTAFYDVTDPHNPVQVLFVPGPDTIWREFKTYGHYAYLVNDDLGDGGRGIQIVDLADPQNPFLVREVTAQFSTCHEIYIDTALALMFCVGAGDNTFIYDLEPDPSNPVHIFTFADFYVHDMTTKGNVGYFAAINNGFLATVDLTALPASLPILDTFVTDGAFTHNVWITEDGQYAYTTDEIVGGHITIVDVSDPNNLFRVGSYSHPVAPGTIVHNVYIRGDYAYASWYEAGIEIMDISNPVAPVRAGFYDTFPSGNGGDFDGAWGIYPFASTPGLVMASDISTGLYVFEFDPNAGELEGTVTDATTTDPIQNVEVTIVEEGVTLQTNASGFYQIELSPGTYTAQYDVFAYGPEERTIVVAPNGTTVQNVAMTRLPAGTLSGTITRIGTGAPISGAVVAILGTPLSGSSSLTGTYSITGVPVGSYTVEAERFGFAPLQQPATIQQSQTTTLNFVLSPAVFVDELESENGWVVGAPGDNATGGIWTRVDPNGTSSGTVQPENDHTPAPGVNCFVTGQGTPGGPIGSADVDNGHTTLTTPVLSTTGLTDPTIVYHRWYSNDAGGSANDVFRADVSNDNGATWVPLEALGSTHNFWERMVFDLDSFIAASAEVRVRFVAEDLSPGSIVEAAIDDFELYAAGSVVSVPGTSIVSLTHLLPMSPNPFRASTLVKFELGARTAATVNVFDVQGRLVRTLARATFDPGVHHVAWDGLDAGGAATAPGVYVVRLETGDAATSLKVVRAGTR
jgi:choice-of-anchor B domain-containing protein